MNRTLAQNTGFSSIRSVSDEAMLESVLRQQNNPVASDHRCAFNFAGRKDHRTRELIVKASRAYMVDGMLRQGVDKFTDMCRGYKLVGPDKPLEKLRKRLDTMTLVGDEPWQTFIDTICLEFFKTGNPTFAKLRGNVPGAKRALYKNNPLQIVSVFPVDIERLEIAYDADGWWRGWRFLDSNHYGQTMVINLIVPGSIVKPGEVGKAWILKPKPVDLTILQPNLDIVHIPYKKAPDTHLGVGLTLTALEDVTLLRSIEQITATVIKKNSHPLIHHQVLRPINTYTHIQAEIEKAGRMHKLASPDGVIVTGGNHEIKILGSESQALRMESYLNHFVKRMCAGMGMSPYLLGFEAATLGVAEASIRILMDKIRGCQETISLYLERYLFWEILYEEGFDPYNSEEDRVYLKFEEVDIDRRIKEETHLADLYAKNVIDIDETRAGMERIKPYNVSKLYLNQVQIPLAKVQTDSDLEIARVAASKRSASEVRSMAEPILPTNGDEVDDFILLMERIYKIDREVFLPISDNMRSLVKDPEALMDLIIQTLVEKS